MNQLKENIDSVNIELSDEILNKINASHYDSLSKEEKDILFRAGGNS